MIRSVLLALAAGGVALFGASAQAGEPVVKPAVAEKSAVPVQHALQTLGQGETSAKVTPVQWGYYGRGWGHPGWGWGGGWGYRGFYRPYGAWGGWGHPGWGWGGWGHRGFYRPYGAWGGWGHPGWGWGGRGWGWGGRRGVFFSIGI